ncbi:hypothetical protein WR25_19581 [Diploscapter pachys]|uniref:Major facilitator superfamily (MFS) profile domain-containing protein n=1 Tax=Diploscapter pachys TaxID=2018661 RepID=A0A2A2LCF2_9BILA|nr:hypothetical protein WR25_19581 [Diploscapter pachys]
MTSTTRRRTMGILTGLLIVDLLAFTSILPLFPTLLSYYEKPEHSDTLYEQITALLRSFKSLIGVPQNDRYNNVFFGGILGSFFCTLQFLSSPTLGSFSDVYGRKKTMIIACVGTLISYIVWLKSSTFTMFLLSRLIGGLSKANINIASAIVSDLYSPEEHPKGMALIGVSYSIGFLIGPMIGAFFSTFASRDDGFSSAPAIFCILLTIIELAAILLLLPETLDFENQKKRSSQPQESKHSLINPMDLFRFNAVRTTVQKRQTMSEIGFIYFVYLFLYSGLEFTLPFLTYLRFQFDSMQQGRIYLFVGLLMLPIQGGLVRRTAMHRQKRLAEWGMICIIPAYILIALCHSISTLYLGLLFYAIASGTVVTSLSSLVNAVHAESDCGTIAGVFRSLGSLARAIGPAFASAGFWLFGPTACYLFGGVLLLTPLLMLRKLPNPVESNKSE